MWSPLSPTTTLWGRQSRNNYSHSVHEGSDSDHRDCEWQSKDPVAPLTLKFIALSIKESRTAGSCMLSTSPICRTFSPEGNKLESWPVPTPCGSCLYNPDEKVCAGRGPWACRPGARVKASQRARLCFHTVPSVLKGSESLPAIYGENTKQIHFSFLWTSWKWPELPSPNRKLWLDFKSNMNK